MNKSIWKALGSVKLTITLFVLILIPSVVGTVIQQNVSNPNQYTEFYGSTWSGIFRFLGFFDVYHDPRFIILLVLLAVNTLVCTLSRLRPKWQAAGMILTHTGLLLILLGAFAGSMLGVKGFMAVREGETTNVMSVGRSNQSVAELPFDVKLKDFILDMHEDPSQKLIVADAEGQKQQSHSMEQGQTISLADSRWAGLASLVGIRPDASATITVKEFLPNAAEIAYLTEGPDPTGTAAMEFQLTGGKNEGQGFVYSGLKNANFIEEANLGIGYKKIDGADSIDDQIRMAGSLFDAGDQLEIRMNGIPGTQVYPATVGSKSRVEGTDYLVEVLRYVPDFVLDFTTREVSSRSDTPNNPAILLKISGPSDSTERWLFAKAPQIHEAGREPFKIRYNNSRVKDYLLVLRNSNQELILAHFLGGELASREKIGLDQPNPIAGTGYELTVRRFFENANRVQEVINRSDVQGRPAVKIALATNGQSQPYILWAETPASLPGIKMMYAQEENIRDFFSILQIIDNGEVVAEKKIEVNDPLRYRGYAFYQSSYDSKMLSWSGLQVSKDPGVPLVYGGFVMQILGMITIFYINPLARRARKPRAVALAKPVHAASMLEGAKGAEL